MCEGRRGSTDVGEGAVGEVEGRGAAAGGSRLALRLLHREPRHGVLLLLRRRRKGEAMACCGAAAGELTSKPLKYPNGGCCCYC